MPLACDDGYILSLDFKRLGTVPLMVGIANPTEAPILLAESQAEVVRYPAQYSTSGTE
jgi:hypothetical protein